MNGMETVQFDRVTNALSSPIKTSNFWSSAEGKEIEEKLAKIKWIMLYSANETNDRAYRVRYHLV